MTNNKHERALEVFKKIIEIDPNNANVHISLAAYYREIGQKNKSYDELRYGFENPNLDIDTKIKILLSYYSITGIYDELKGQAYELAEILVKVHPEDAKAHSIYADFLFRDDKFIEARDEFRLVLSYDSSKYIIWEQLLIIESELNDFKAMAKESKRAMALFPEQPLPYLYSGEALYRLKRANEAVRDLKMGINFVVENNAILVVFYERLGDAYFHIGEDELSDNAFDKAVKYWEKAASLGKGSEFLDKKIKNKKLFE